jgi:drug/metabolite transporter (DMT)-like permease
MPRVSVAFFNMNPAPAYEQRTPTWTIALALVYLYIAWGTTYFAIKHGVTVEELPPMLFAGSRVCLAGIMLLVFLAWRGRSLGLTGRDLSLMVLTGAIFFVGGNGMLTLAEQTVDSGVAAVIAATTPIWVAVLGWLWPHGERLRLGGWLGLLIGLSGVLLLLVPKLTAMHESRQLDVGPLLMLGSTLSWAVGIVLLRHAPARCDLLVASGYQMLIGGGVLTMAGIIVGEPQQLPPEATPGAVTTFVYLLVFGSLLGFIAFSFLLRHVSAALVGTHAYVNPIIAILIGWVCGETVTGWLGVGIVAVLLGVLLVRLNQAPAALATGPEQDDVGRFSRTVREGSGQPSYSAFEP